MTYKLRTSESFFTDAEVYKLSDLGFKFSVNLWLNYTHRIQNESTVNIVTIGELNEFAKEWGDIAIKEEGGEYVIELMRVRI